MKITYQQRSFLYRILLIVVLLTMGFFLSTSKSLERLDLVLYDMLLPLQSRVMSEQVVVVAIDDASIQALGRWPWSRRHHAQLLEQLTSMGARVIGIDILFSEEQKDDPEADILLAQALKNNGKTILPVAPAKLTSFDPVSENLPIPEFAVVANSLGHVDVELDIDGLCRRFFLFAGLGDAHWPTFALAMIQAGGDMNELQVEGDLLKNNNLQWLRQEVMFIPFAKREEHPRILSYMNVLSGRVLESDVRDKYVLVGVTATGLGDVISTPASTAHERMPGVELNAQILSGLLQGIYVYELPEIYQIVLTLMLITLAAIFVILLPLRTGFIIILIAFLAITAVSITLLMAWQIWFPPIVALLITAMIWPLWSVWQLGIDSRLKKHLQDKLEHQSRHHFATGLPNHYMLENKLNEVQTTSSGISALLILHLDWPGSASVVLGRPMGDNILKVISERLRTSVAGECFIAHLNGDDFAVLLTNLKNRDAVKEIANNLLNKLQAPLTEGKQQFLLAPQIGVSIWPSDGDAISLLRNAYAAMFKSRIDNTDHLCIYSTDIGQKLQVRSQLEQALICALERNEFEVYYQPQFNANSGRIVGVEALLRWKSPSLGWVSPEIFIPVAEHVGLIKNIGDWVLEVACQQLRSWHDSELGPLRLAVNVSPLQFIDPTLLSKISATIKHVGIKPNELELEITESSLMYDVDSAVQVMHLIKQEGMELAIDDFGTGYSSLSSLRSFPIDRLKIDQSFTREIGKDNDATEITLTILSMAKHLGLKVIAEGIETNEQAAFLRKHGCDEFQGFLFSKAISAEDLTLFLKNDVN